MSTRATFAEDFWDRPLRDLFQTLQTTPAGLTSDEANRRLRLYGPNSFVPTRAALTEMTVRFTGQWRGVGLGRHRLSF